MIVCSRFLVAGPVQSGQNVRSMASIYLYLLCWDIQSK
jgi:hypothetical protein